jgi:ABC-type Fe3+-siderophore transport system permease subunit
MKRIIVICLAWLLLAPTVYAQDKDVLIVFKLTSDETTAELTESVNTELNTVLVESGKYQLVEGSELAEETLMPPAEALAFCNDEPECIANLGSSVKARWILYGDIKESFDGKKILVHLAIIDVPEKKLDQEKYGQYARKSNIVIDTTNMLRELLGLEIPELEPGLGLDLAPEPKPKPQPKPEPIVKPKPIAADKPIAKIKPKPPKTIEVKAQGPKTVSPWTNPWTLTTASVGVASLTIGAILGVLSKNRLDDAKTNGLSQPAAYDLVSQAEDFALGANIAYGIGGAALTAAVIIFIVDITDDEPVAIPTVACSAGSCSFGLSARF